MMAEPAKAEGRRLNIAVRMGRVRRLTLVPDEPAVEPAGSVQGAVGESMSELLSELGGIDAGLVRLLQRVLDNETPFVVVSPVAISGWRARVPEAWTRAEGWLRHHGIAIVEV